MKKEIQQFVRDKAILASHPTAKTLEEAKMIEIDLSECAYMKDFEVRITTCINAREEHPVELGDVEPEYILGLPLTLAKINLLFDDFFLRNKLEYHLYYFDGEILMRDFSSYAVDKICNWQLLNKDGSERVFEQQSEETQLAIAESLGYEK